MNSVKYPNQPLKIILLDDDPIFRLGICTALTGAKFADLQIIAQGKTEDLTNILAEKTADLLVLALDLVRYPEQLNYTVVLCQQLQNRYPSLVIFLLISNSAIETIKKIPGVKGCCPKGVEIEELVTALRVCAKGGTFFQSAKTSQRVNKKMGGWLYNQGKFGLDQIDSNLEIINSYIQRETLSLLDSWYWKGRRRELRVARWLISQILPEEYEAEINLNQSWFNNQDQPENSQDSSLTESSDTPLIPLTVSPQNIWELTRAKIQSSLENKTGIILEIDILKKDKQQELLLIIIQQIRRILDDLKVINLDSKSLGKRHSIILQDLWQSSTLTFLSRYYSEDENKPYNLLNLTLDYSKIMEKEDLKKIPFTLDLLAYWLFEQPLKIDNNVYKYQEDKSNEIEEILLANLVLSTANMVTQFILNKFSDLPKIRYYLYNQEWNNTRKITMFRNNLSWRYRQEKYWENPQDVFEDQYRVLKLEYQGITRGTISHPRHQELNQLKGLPWTVTIIVEFRDSISKGVKALGDLIGKSLVYLLTEVIGKGIGLIGRGILQGVGKKIRS
jgi:hypothetical protein